MDSTPVTPAPIPPSSPQAPLSPSYGAPDDSPSFVMALLGFCIPLVGLILYLVQRDKTPLRARSAGRGAAWGFGLSIVATILFVMLAILVPVFSRARSNAEKQRTSVQ